MGGGPQYGVRSVAVSARLAVNQKASVRLRSGTLIEVTGKARSWEFLKVQQRVEVVAVVAILVWNIGDSQMRLRKRLGVVAGSKTSRQFESNWPTLIDL